MEGKLKTYDFFSVIIAVNVPSQTYRDDPKFSDSWANSVDPDQTAPGGAFQEQSDQGLHCLPFRLHLLDSLLYDRAT